MGDSRSTVMYKIVHEDPITLNVLNRTVPAGVSAAVMRALGKDPTQRFPTCSAFAAAVRVGLAGGTVELPAGPSADLETVLLDPQAVSDADTVVVETAATAGPPIIPAAGRRGSRRWRTAVVAAVVLAALGAWTWLAPPEPAGGAWWALRERAGRTWVVLSGGVGTTTPGPTDTCAGCSGTRISRTGESRIQPTGSEHLAGRYRSRARRTSARCPRG